MDYGFHAPTMTFPVPGTLMIEPTESESQRRARPLLRRDDRDPRRRSARSRRAASTAEDNPLKNAPHTAAAVTASEWSRPYSREQAAFPLRGCASHKYWPPVARIDNAYGDRNLVCTCPSVEDAGQ